MRSWGEREPTMPRAQVHRAVLRGKDVAVKVQRTGLDALFKNDLQNLKFAATVFDKIDPKSDGADRDWVSASPTPTPSPSKYNHHIHAHKFTDTART